MILLFEDDETIDYPTDSYDREWRLGNGGGYGAGNLSGYGYDGLAGLRHLQTDDVKAFKMRGKP